MATLRLETLVNAPPAICFDLSRDIDLHTTSMARSRERAVAGVTSGLIGINEEVTWEARHFGRSWRVTSRVTEFEPNFRFVDEMIEPGPFAHFRHEHVFEPVDGGTSMIDQVDMSVRYSLVRLPGDAVAKWYLLRLLGQRNAVIKKVAESDR